MCVQAPATHNYKVVFLMRCSPMCVCCTQEEDEVPDDETVNQMIARSEEEFDQFMVSNFKTAKKGSRSSQAADVVQPP